MNPTATLRLRQITAAIAVTWALLSLLFSIVGNSVGLPEAGPPLNLTSGTGRLLVQGGTPEALEAGLEPGDVLVEVDGIPGWQWMIEERWRDYTEPYALAVQVEEIIPDEPGLEELFEVTARAIDISSDPPGADVYYRRYEHPEEEWQYLGRTPIEQRRLLFGLFIDL